MRSNTSVFSGQYEYNSIVSHKGTVVAFAIDQDRKFYYNVLDMGGTNEKTQYDKDCWLNSPRRVKFPKEFSVFGYAALGNTKVLAHDEQNRLIENPNALHTTDPFNSSTEKVTALGNFQVISDGVYIYLFRQSLSHQDCAELGMQAAKDGFFSGSTLLIDRFVLAGNELKPTTQMRYKRSRDKLTPGSSKDTFSDRGVDDKLFYEPT